MASLPSEGIAPQPPPLPFFVYDGWTHGVYFTANPKNNDSPTEGDLQIASSTPQQPKRLLGEAVCTLVPQLLAGVLHSIQVAPHLRSKTEPSQYPLFIGVFSLPE